MTSIVSALVPSVIAAVIVAWIPSSASAARLIIGDIDSFGFAGDVATLIGPDGIDGNGEVPADVDGDGRLTPGDLSVDVDDNGFAGINQGDQFDNRALSELNDPDYWTDVSLFRLCPPPPGKSCEEPDVATPPGGPNEISLLFDLTGSEFDGQDFGTDHRISLTTSDFARGVITATIDGVPAELFVIAPGPGGVRRHLVRVPASALADRKVLLEFSAPDEPYAAIDFATLSPGSLTLPALSRGGVLMLTFGLVACARRLLARAGRVRP